MTYRNDDNDDTVVEETHEERRPAPGASGDQVNVNAGSRTTYAEPNDPLAVVRRVLGLIFGIILALIALRILLLALGANEGNALVDGIYGITEPLVAPFRGVFSMDEVRPTGNSVFDIAAVVAIVGWSLLWLLITAILRIAART